MKAIKLFSAMLLVVPLAGCVHALIINPNQSAITTPAPVEKIHKNVGYFIAQADKDLQVVTAGGGGDKVGSYPYRDLDAGIYSVLSNVFDNARPLNSANDADQIAKSNITYVFTPKIDVTSSSDSAFTWPPTKFTVSLDCKVFDAKGVQIAEKQVQGAGAAEFSEFSGNFSLSGQRASTDALQKLQAMLLASPEFKN